MHMLNKAKAKAQAAKAAALAAAASQGYERPSVELGEQTMEASFSAVKKGLARSMQQAASVAADAANRAAAVASGADTDDFSRHNQAEVVDEAAAMEEFALAMQSRLHDVGESKVAVENELSHALAEIETLKTQNMDLSAKLRSISITPAQADVQLMPSTAVQDSGTLPPSQWSVHLVPPSTQSCGRWTLDIRQNSVSVSRLQSTSILDAKNAELKKTATEAVAKARMAAEELTTVKKSAAAEIESARANADAEARAYQTNVAQQVERMRNRFTDQIVAAKQVAAAERKRGDELESELQQLRSAADCAAEAAANAASTAAAELVEAFGQADAQRKARRAAENDLKKLGATNKQLVAQLAAANAAKIKADALLQQARTALDEAESTISFERLRRTNAESLNEKLFVEMQQTPSSSPAWVADQVPVEAAAAPENAKATSNAKYFEWPRWSSGSKR
eukprot:SAG31_NODE_839_length_11600_cov_3.351013_8_plen_453_part_00